MATCLAPSGPSLGSHPKCLPRWFGGVGGGCAFAGGGSSTARTLVGLKHRDEVDDGVSALDWLFWGAGSH